MCIHLGLEIQCEEFVQEGKGIRDHVLWNPMVLDVKESAVMTSVIYAFGY